MVDNRKTRSAALPCPPCQESSSFLYPHGLGRKSQDYEASRLISSPLHQLYVSRRTKNQMKRERLIRHALHKKYLRSVRIILPSWTAKVPSSKLSKAWIQGWQYVSWWLIWSSKKNNAHHYSFSRSFLDPLGRQFFVLVFRTFGILVRASLSWTVIFFRFVFLWVIFFFTPIAGFFFDSSFLLRTRKMP